jgi:hypothetical protein
MTGDTVGGRALIDAAGGQLQQPRIWDIDLSVARTNVGPFRIDGYTSIAVDPRAYDSVQSRTPSSTLFAGVASIVFGLQSGDPLPLEGGLLMRCPANTIFWISNAAQTGRMLRLYLCPPAVELKFYQRPETPYTGPATAFQVTVAAVATLISASQAGRKSIMIRNNDAAATLFLGPTSAVLTTTGMPLSPGQTVVFSESTSAWYGIASAGTIDTRVVVEG